MAPDANVTGKFCLPPAQDTSRLAGGRPAMALTTSLGSRSFLLGLDLWMNLAEDMISRRASWEEGLFMTQTPQYGPHIQ